jgi:hypothetical protein
MATTGDAQSSAAIPRVSRYRSTRQGQTKATSQDSTPSVPPVPPLNPATSVESMQRMKSMSRYHARPATRAGPAGGTPLSPSQFPPQSPTTTSRSSSMGSRSIDTSRPRQGAPYAFGQLPKPPPPAIAPNKVYQQSNAHTSARPQTAHTNAAHSAARYVGQRRATGGSTAEEVARAILDRETERHARIRQAQEAERDAKRKMEEEARRQEEAARRREELAKKAEEDIKRQKQEVEEKAKLQREREKEELRRVAREEKEEAELWAAKKKSEAEKKKQREKLEREMSIRSKNSPLVLQNTSITAQQVEISSAMKEKVNFFKRWKVDELPTSALDYPRPKTSAAAVPPADDKKPTIKPGGVGIVPRIDAPVSAVNHGDRIVRVSSQGTTIMLPVKPTTTPLQLIRTSVTFFSFPIDPRNSLLLESFSKSGIQRPLRMYEHIRDVLNSWDSDDQHQLILEPYDSSTDNKLFSHSAPKVKPQGGTWTMYFSQKRGKWDKRFITLTPEGQITSAKNESGKDQTNVCNLSDFEIFSLSKEGEKKKVKPPKKHCFAIKSMQKSSMFLGETGFIHLFCCADEALGRDFHDAVFRWRTWYLVHVMGEGTTGPPKIGENSAASNSAPLLSASGGPGTGHKRGSSIASQYVLGSFNTGLDFDAGSFAINYDDKPRPKHMRLPSDVPLAGAINVPAGTNGAPSALEHSKALHARQLSIRRAANVNGTGLPSQQHSRHLSTDAHSSSTLQRNTSVRSTKAGAHPSLDFSRANGPGGIAGGPPQTSPGPMQTSFYGIKPLVDLTPQYLVPPQHQRKGRGFKPATMGRGGLVESATGPELAPGAIVIPEAKDWRRRGDSISQVARPQTGVARSGSVRSITKGTGAPAAAGGRGLLGDLSLNEGFTGGGLLGEKVTGVAGTGRN